MCPSAFVSLVSYVPRGPVTDVVASLRPRPSLKAGETHTHMGFSRLPTGRGGPRGLSRGGAELEALGFSQGPPKENFKLTVAYLLKLGLYTGSGLEPRTTFSQTLPPMASAFKERGCKGKCSGPGLSSVPPVPPLHPQSSSVQTRNLEIHPPEP